MFDNMRGLFRNFDSKYKFIDSYNFYELDTEEVLKFYKPFSTYEINNAIHIGDSCKVIEFYFDDLDSIRLFIDKLIDRDIVFKLSLEYLPLGTVDWFDDEKYGGKVFVFNNDYSEVSVKRYNETEIALNNLICDLKASELSPLEKYLCIYDIVKNYKAYKDNEADYSLSRDLYKILDNDYMVCVGYSELLRALCLRANIQAAVDLVSFQDMNSLEVVNHMRNLVFLKDDKYNIDGYFVADPTFDNCLERDYYVHALSPINSCNYRVDFLQMFESVSLVHVASFKEFLYKVNSNDCYLDNLFNCIFYDLDVDYYCLMANRYNDLFVDNFGTSGQKMAFLYNVYKHISKKVNVDIPAESMICASMVTEFYKNPNMGDDLFLELLKEKLDNNMRFYRLLFPPILLEDGNGEHIIANEENPFSISTENVKRYFKKSI